MSIGQNLNITLPTSGQVQWDSPLNTALQALIDTVQAQVTADGIDIASALDFQGNYAINLNGLSFKTSTDPGVSESIFWAIPIGATAPELFVRDGAGNSLQVTSKGALNVSAATGAFTNLAGTAGAATFSSGNGTFTFTSAPGQYATVEGGDVKVHVGSTTSYTDIKGSPNLASTYSLTLPVSPPTTVSLLIMDTTGTLLCGNGGLPPLPLLSASSNRALLSTTTAGLVQTVQSATFVDTYDAGPAATVNGTTSVYSSLGWTLAASTSAELDLGFPTQPGDLITNIEVNSSAACLSASLFFRDNSGALRVMRTSFNGNVVLTFRPLLGSVTLTGSFPYTMPTSGSLFMALQNGTTTSQDSVAAIRVTRTRRIV